MNKPQLDRLLELIKIPTRSGKEYYVRDYITQTLNELGIKHDVDDNGNVMSLIPSTPMLCAHMDAVTDSGDNLFLSDKYIRVQGFLEGHDNEAEKTIEGFGNLGADDKLGIFIILEVLRKRKEAGLPNISFLFTVEEEIGGNNGSKYVSKKMASTLQKINYCIVLDRKGSGDVIGFQNKYCSKEFENGILGKMQDNALLKKYGFKPAKGYISDADHLAKQVSCVNLSVGYYNAHTYMEYISTKDVMNTMNAVEEAINSLPNYRFPTYREENPRVKVKPIGKLGSKLVKKLFKFFK